MVHESYQMVEDAAEILVEDHTQREAGLIDVLMEALTDSHQYDLDHLLEFVARHLHFVEEALWPGNFVPVDGQSARRMPQVISAAEAALLGGSVAGLALAILPL